MTDLQRSGSSNPRPTADSSDSLLLLHEGLERLEAHLVRERFRGYDPYDALSSPLFRLPFLRSSKWIRLATQQLLRRSPYNIRPLLGIPKGYNPVTLACVLEGAVYRAQVDEERADIHRERAAHCVVELARLRAHGYSGACWGYPFDWEARYARVPAGTPTIVATGIVTNSLFLAHRVFGLDQALEMCESAGQFILADLPRFEEAGTFCWGYFPQDTRQRVLNATMKGARLCAQIFAATGDRTYLEPAAQTVAYVARHQRGDGSWPYAVGDTRRWTDNFHTGYVLDALDSYEHCSGDRSFGGVKENGWRYYRHHFFEDDEIPKYYSDELFPIDATACAQSLLTLCRFGDQDVALRVASWAIRRMQCADGHFAYQLKRRRMVSIPYIRWASAYMYAGLSRVTYELAVSSGRDRRATS